MVENTMEVAGWLRKQLAQASPDLLREMVQDFAEALMGAEAEALCGAAYGERSPERVNTRNGYRPRRWDTRVGTIALEIPKLREGSYFPDWLLTPRRRAEQALVAVVADCYLAGVSTRRVEKLVQTLGIERISKSQVSRLAASLDELVEDFRSRPLEDGPYPYLMLDALVVKCREGGRTVNACVVHAVAVNAEGYRESLGLDVVTSEDGAAWTAFLRGLVARGLAGVRLVTSDAHPGLVDAIAATLPGAAWQRCRTHFVRNLQSRVPKSAQSFVATMVRSIFAQPDADSVHEQHARVVCQLEERFPAAAAMLADAGPEILAFTGQPKEHWRQLWSNNPLERLNREIRRRTDVVGIFPDRPSIIRLVGAVLAEQQDEWAVARRCYGRGFVKGPGEVVPERAAVRAGGWSAGVGRAARGRGVRDVVVRLSCEGWLPHDRFASRARGLQAGAASSESWAAQAAGASVSVRAWLVLAPLDRLQRWWLQLEGGDLPAEGRQLAGDRDGDDRVALAALLLECLPALVEPPLGTPADLDHARMLAALTHAELVGDTRRAPIVPGRLNEQAARVLGAGLRDRTLAALLARGVLARDDTEIAGEQPRMLEAGEVADLGGQPGGGEGADPAQAAQPTDRLGSPRAERDLLERGLELVTPGEHAVVRVERVGEGKLGGAVVEAQAAQPVAVPLRPGVARQRVVQLAAEQELRDPRPAAHQVDAQVLARADEVAQLLLRRLGHPHHPQLAGEQ